MINIVRKISIIGVVSVALAVTAFYSLPGGSAYAQSLTDDPAPATITPTPDEPNPPENIAGNIRETVLEKLFQREQKNHDNQQKLIDQADKLGNRVAEGIARAKENHKDTTNLKKALADFNEKIGQARLAYDQTGKLIKQHPGFDAQGKIIDAAAAKTTVEAIGKGSKEVRQTVIQALKELLAAGKAFREANPRPTNPPAANPV
ncbi:MAG TPA: hypothetical protein VF338_03185 [Leptolinea sp.]